METPGGGGNSLHLYTRPALMGKLPVCELCQRSLPSLWIPPSPKEDNLKKCLGCKWGVWVRAKQKQGRKLKVWQKKMIDI